MPPTSRTVICCFRRVIEQAERDGYHYTMVDCPPTLGLIATNILMASTDVVIPVGLTYLATDGCAEIVSSIRSLHKRYADTPCKLSMVVPTMYRKTNLADQIVVMLKRHFPNELSKVILAMNVKLGRSPKPRADDLGIRTQRQRAQMMRTFALEFAKKVLLQKS